MKVALDIDDVLAGFYPGACIAFNKPEKRINIWDGQGEANWILENVQHVDNDPIFWAGLPVVSNPNSITFEIECYITSSPKKMIPFRKEWLSKHGFPQKPIYYSSNKLDAMRVLDIDILIDDKPSTVDTINDSGDKIALQFKPSYMSANSKDSSKIITHLSEVNTFMK